MAGSGIITIDIGTTSMRAILFDDRGAQLATARRDNPPTYHPDGRVEQSAGTWSAILEQVLAECAGSAASRGMAVRGIALTSQRSSLIPVDRDGAPLHPTIMWQDVRTRSMCLDLEPENPFVYRICGMRVSPVMTAIKIRWMREHVPDVYRRTWKMVGIHDFVLNLLTGRFLTDSSLASRTNLLNLAVRDWDPDLMALFGVERSMLCDMVEPGSVAGALLPGLAARVALPAGLPVVTAGGDQQCAALGLGLTAPDRIVANTGTGSYLLAYSDRPVFDPGMRAYCNAAAIPGAYVVEASLPASGVIYRWFDETFFPRGTPSCDDFSTVNAEASASPPGADGLVFLPHFKGSGAPHFNPDAKGVFWNVHLGTTRGDMARAILEGIVAEMADNLDLLESMTRRVERINASGGLTRLALFNRIQADMYGRKLRMAEHGEATALGAWMSAAKALGLYPGFDEAAAAASGGAAIEELDPDPSTARAYAELRAARRSLYRSLYGDA